jgi:hypothetical protein
MAENRKNEKRGTGILVADRKYEGKYVALKSFTDNTVLCFGDDPVDVMKRARTGRTEEPVIVFIPEHNTSHIY